MLRIITHQKMNVWTNCARCICELSQNVDFILGSLGMSEMPFVRNEVKDENGLFMKVG